MTIEQTPHGKKFSASIQAILQRDCNWVDWKKSKCLHFSKLKNKKRKEAPDGSESEVRLSFFFSPLDFGLVLTCFVL